MAIKKSGITRRVFNGVATGAGLAVSAPVAWTQKGRRDVTTEMPGIWRRRLGVPERLTPVSMRRYEPVRDAFSKLQAPTVPPFEPTDIVGKASRRGYQVTLPLAPGEMIYGLGLQFQSVLQRGRKKTLRVNADPSADLGDSHAPVPFYVSTLGYGIFIDTARYLTLYCGSTVQKNAPAYAKPVDPEMSARIAQLPKAFERFRMNEARQVIVEVPDVEGVDIYVMGGPTLRHAVQRYNLFAGGGALPPRWGLGFWYRIFGDASQEDVLAMAREFRARRIPCDVLGLEPGWQTHSYSCSFRWSNRFPEPDRMITWLREQGFQVNLWEHAFTHSSAPFYNDLKPYSGDYQVWDGLVPDFLDDRARKVFGDYHERTLIARGVAGFKLDECDNSDFTRNWSFPELSSFPSGADGEQMHCFFGLRYQDTIHDAFVRQKKRTLGLVRSSHALASPYPFALYSDLYDHKEFIRGVVNAGFSGLLWCPEVRDATNSEDLLRRLQTTVFSPVAMVNAWYIRNPPWKQVNREANNAGTFSANWEELEAACKRWIDLRMQFVPYLYSAFVRYHLEGLPPFRALVMDYPKDPQTWALDNQYMMGDSVLVAPVVAGEREREIYLPEGEWFDFWTGKKEPGRQRLHMDVPLDRIPLFVKSGTLLPLATVSLHTGAQTGYALAVRGYGSGELTCKLYEDDASLQPVLTTVSLGWRDGEEQGTIRRSGPQQTAKYNVSSWQRILG